jgi:hypothetical protein
MTVKNAAGTTQTKTAVMASMADVTPVENKVYKFNGSAELYRAFTPEGTSTVEGGRALALVPGRIYTQTEIDRLFPAATVASATPSTVAVAGGTAVTFRGDNLTGVTAITLGGTGFTAVTVVDERTVTATSPAKTAGTHDVVFTDDSGTVTKTAFMTSA